MPDEKELSPLKNFGLKVKSLRKERNLSQEELADKAKMHRTYIGMIERGEKSISLNKIFDLAEALEISVKDLF